MKRTISIIPINTFILLGLFFCVIPDALAQKEELIIKLENPGEAGSFTFENTRGSVSIEGYDGDYILIAAAQRNNSAAFAVVPEGMTLISQRKIGLRAESSGNIVRLFSESDLTIDFEIKVPRNFSLKIASLDNGNVFIARINGAVEVENRQGNISLININGSCIASTVYGRIMADTRSLKAEETIMLTSYDGDIELEIPVSLSASFMFKSNKGEIMSEPDIKVLNKTVSVNENMGQKEYKVDSWTRGIMNGGGNSIILSSYSGDIYIRKGARE